MRAEGNVVSTNSIRVLLCGFVAGVVWFLLSAFFLSLFAENLVTFVKRGGGYPRWDGGVFFAIDLMMGIWAVWLYSAIAPRYGAGPRTAAIVGVAWWIIKSLQSAKWVGIGLIPQDLVLVPLATTLVAAVVASVAAAWIFDRVNMPAAKEPTAT